MARNIKNLTEKSIEPPKNPQFLNSTKHVKVESLQFKERHQILNFFIVFCRKY
jgi:hypothetical protein